MDFLKGNGRPVVVMEGTYGKIELLVFADGSGGITCNGLMHSIWEASEAEDCFRAFLQKVAVSHAALETITILNKQTELEPVNHPVDLNLSRHWPLN
jgi:hypothetical protein